MKSKSYFADRGIQSDASPDVKKYFVDNERFIEDLGAGDFGFTYASWEEMTQVASDSDFNMEDSREWRQAFSLAESLSSDLFSSEQIRFVVYANW